MEECACLCGLGSSRGCRCRQEPRGPAETAAAEGKRCPQKRQRPAETAEANDKPAPAEKHLEAAAATPFCAGSGGTASPMPPPHCSLQDLPVEMLVEIFASLPGTDLASLAQVCTKFRRILHIDSIWRRRCREEFGVCENLQDLETVGTSYREVYAKLLHPYRHILGLWQRDAEGLKTLLYVAVDGLGITAWTDRPCLHLLVDGPMQFKPAFRIRLTETQSAAVECMEGRHRRPHGRRLQIRKDRLRTRCKKTDHLKDLPTRLLEKWGQILVPEDRRRYDCRTYRRLYLPPSHPDDLIRPGLFQRKPNYYGLIAVLSFHGKCARLTPITGTLFPTLQIHLMRRIEMRGGEIFWDVDALSRVVREMEEQVLREQQQHEDGTEDSEGRGGMCFYGVSTSIYNGFTESSTGVVVTLFDENRFGFLCLQERAFSLFGRVQNTFGNAEAPSPQAFLEMLSSIRS
ncbi:F-box only protein 31-like [Myotis myotis]|uniref:F-box only protein 31-like n=1 Tax=Myotis myotis TaxID=51298 RepID=UPI00174D6087|nr:F-box only protein 31-like [Myotis myotis]